MKLIRKFAAIGTICLVFAGSACQVAQGQQRTTSLFSTGCVERGFASTDNTNISIGRELFTSIYKMGAGSNPFNEGGSGVTCRIRPGGSPPRFKTLRLAFGMADDERSKGVLEVNIYVDGVQVESRSIGQGNKALVLLDVSRASSIAIEIPWDKNSFGYIRFFQALLEPISSSPGRRQ